MPPASIGPQGLSRVSNRTVSTCATAAQWLRSGCREEAMLEDRGREQTTTCSLLLGRQHTDTRISLGNTSVYNRPHNFTGWAHGRAQPTARVGWQRPANAGVCRLLRNCRPGSYKRLQWRFPPGARVDEGLRCAAVVGAGIAARRRRGEPIEQESGCSKTHCACNNSNLHSRGS